MAGHRSSQYFTALMMAGVRAQNPLTIHIEGDLVVAAIRHHDPTHGPGFRRTGRGCKQSSITLQPSQLQPPVMAIKLSPTLQQRAIH